MSKEVIRNDEAIRILVVEDDPNLVKEMQSQLELKLRSLVSEHGYEFSELIVNVQSTIKAAKYIIKVNEKFHLFVLDVSVKAESDKNLQGNGLTLIEYAISEGKKPNAVVVLTSCDDDARKKGGSDLGRAIVGKFYHPRSHESLFKNVSASRTLADLVAFLSEKINVEGKKYSRLISLVMFQAFFTISHLENDGIEVRFSGYTEPYPPSNDRVRKFLLFLAQRKLLSETDVINDVCDGVGDRDVAQSEVSRIRKHLVDDGHFRKEDIKESLFYKTREGYRLADGVKLEGF
jgi:CheY-like chemotaxis protein